MCSIPFCQTGNSRLDGLVFLCSRSHNAVGVARVCPCQLNLTYIVSQIKLNGSLTEILMTSLVVSSKGQIVLPAALRRRLGIGAGARLEVFEESDGVKLRVVRAVPQCDVHHLAGMLKAPTRGVPRSLDDFDAADFARRLP